MDQTGWRQPAVQQPLGLGQAFHRGDIARTRQPSEDQPEIGERLLAAPPVRGGGLDGRQKGRSLQGLTGDGREHGDDAIGLEPKRLSLILSAGEYGTVAADETSIAQVSETLSLWCISRSPFDDSGAGRAAARFAYPK